MNNYPAKIKNLLDKAPQLAKLLKNPIVLNESSFASALIEQIEHVLGKQHQDDLYRLVFPEGASRELMTHSKGELKGLSMGVIMEKGKISGQVGLEKVNNVDSSKLHLPALLAISFYLSVRQQLSYITHVVTDIRNHQLIEQQARFERISEVIADSFASIPNMTVDASMRDIYLARIIRNNDDCLEIFIAQREQLKVLLGSEPYPTPGGYREPYVVGAFTTSQTYYPGTFFENKILGHPIFAVFQRMVAGRICEIIISGNLSHDNIAKHREFVERHQTVIYELLKGRLDAFRNYRSRQTVEIQHAQPPLSDEQKHHAEKYLDAQDRFVESSESRLDKQLAHRAEDFSMLQHLTEQEKIVLYLADGMLFIDGNESDEQRE